MWVWPLGATAVLVPEEPIDFDRDVIEKIRQARLNGFTHYMIVVAEGAGSAAEIAVKIKEAIDLDPRVTVLGHIQRGGTLRRGIGSTLPRWDIMQWKHSFREKADGLFVLMKVPLPMWISTKAFP